MNRSKLTLPALLALLALPAFVSAQAGIAERVVRTRIQGVDVIAYRTAVKDVVTIYGSLPAGDAFADPANPDVATLTEQGFPPFEAAVWFSLVGPAGLPRDVVTKINTETNRILQMPDTRERFRTLGMDAAGGTPEQLALHIRSETAKWGRLIREKNIKPD